MIKTDLPSDLYSVKAVLMLTINKARNSEIHISSIKMFHILKWLLCDIKECVCI